MELMMKTEMGVDDEGRDGVNDKDRDGVDNEDRDGLRNVCMHAI